MDKHIIRALAAISCLAIIIICTAAVPHRSISPNSPVPTESDIAASTAAEAAIRAAADVVLTTADTVLGTNAVAATRLTGNIALARMTNALDTATGVLITNTCIAADGKTNTTVFVPIGGVYMVKSLTTSP